MKNLLLAIGLAASLAVGCSSNESKTNEENVPTAVVASYQQKYPGAVTKKWKMEKEDGNLVYEVKFKMNDKNMEAEFLPDGTFSKEE